MKERPHIKIFPLSHARGKFVPRAGALPCADVLSHEGAAPHALEKLFAQAGRVKNGRKKIPASFLRQEFFTGRQRRPRYFFIR